MSAARHGGATAADTMTRNLAPTSGDVTLHMPRLKGVSFETAIIERYRRRESSVEEVLIEMYLRCSVRPGKELSQGPVGQPSLTRHHQRAEQESLREKAKAVVA